MWTIWIERNDMVFNHTQWHEARVKQRIWNKLIIYGKIEWKRMNELITTNSFAAMALLQRFDRTWGARSVLCWRHNLRIEWNWKRNKR